MSKKVDEQMANMVEVVSSSSRHNGEGGFFLEVQLDKDFVVDKKTQALLRAVVRIARRGEKSPIVGLRGPTGTGKTSLPMWLAAILNQKKEGTHPVYVLDCPTLREPKDVFGFKDIVPDGRGGQKIIWRRSAFVEAIQTPSSIVILDEATRIPPPVMNGLMPLLDHRGSVWLEDLGEQITVAEGVIFFVTANIGLEYSGTWKWDAAFQNRLHCQIDVDYLGAEDEVRVVVAKTGVDEEVAEGLVQVANIVRQKVRDDSDSLSEAISTRQLLNTAELCVEGLPPADAMVFTVLPNYAKDGGTDSERAMVLNIIQGKLGNPS